MRTGLAAAIAVGLLLGGCASSNDMEKWFATTPPTTDLSVTSEPAGAQARSSTGQSCAATPCVLRVPASAEQFTVTVSRQGFIDQTVDVRLSEPGMTGDGNDGGMRSLIPNPVGVTLEAAPPPPPPAKKKPGKKRTTSRV